MKFNPCLTHLAAMLCISLLSSCTTDIEPPPPPPEPLSSSAGEAWSYCVYPEIQQCFPGSYSSCPGSGGLLGNVCPYSSSGYAQSSSGGGALSSGGGGVSSSGVALSSSSSIAGQSSSGGGAVPGYNYCVFVADKTCLPGNLTDCPPGGALSNECPFGSSSSIVSVSSSSVFVAASSSSSKVSYCNYGRCSQWSSDGWSCLMHENGWPNEGGCYQMPTEDNCNSGTIVSTCPAGTEPPAATAKPSSSSIVPSSSSSAIVGGGLCDGFVDGTTREHYGKVKAQFCDSRDGRRYVYVTIGEQVWMAENLNYNASGSKCYGNSESNCTTYGRLYDWVTAMDIASTYSSSLYSASGTHKGICPSGWHIPSNAEWDTLMQYVANCSILTSNCANAGGLLKATSGWNNNGNGIDAYGFAALPSGHSNGNAFAYIGTDGDWWSSENKASTAYRWHMEHDKEYSDWQYANKTFFWGVRCLQN